MTMKNFFKGASSPTAIALIAANCVPLTGALFFGWSIFSLMFLFWLENVIIGALNIIRFLGATPPEGDEDANNRGARIFMLCLQLFFAGFFTVHYGGFCFVHGMFVFAMFGKEAGVSMPRELSDTIALAGRLLVKEKLLIAALSIFASHLFSLVYNYFIKGERRGADIQQIMARPYGRVVVLHITIIFGGFAVMALGSPIWALVLLLVLKTIVDLKAHLLERAKMEGKHSPNSVYSRVSQAMKKANRPGA